MSSENGWIPWDDRTNLPCIYIKVCSHIDYSNYTDEKIQNLIVDEAGNKLDKDNIEYFKNGIDEKIIVRLGRVPVGYLERVLNSFYSHLIVYHYDDSGNNTWNFEWVKFQDEISFEEEQEAIEYLMSFQEFGDEFFSGSVYSALFEAKQEWEEFDREYSLHRKKFGSSINNKNNSAFVPAVSVAPAVPMSAPVDKESSAVLFVPEFDGSNDWIKIPEMAQEMVDNEISIDIEAAKKHLRNMKSNGMKSAEKYDGKNSTYGEINISSFQVKWRMVRNGGKWNVFFYRPSLKWEQKR